MRLSQIATVITKAYGMPKKRPVMTWGPPGVGKSDTNRAVSEALGIDFIDMRLSLYEPIDLRGLPTLATASKEQVARWIPPEMLPRKGKGILMLDELPQAAPSMQAAASQLILDRRIGEYELPEGWLVTAGGNQKKDKSAVNEMPWHIRNRFIHLYAEVSVDEWIAWALKHDIDIRCIAFIKWRPTHLHNFDPQAKGEAFASPRTWEFASDLLKTDLSPDVELDVMNGTIGQNAASEFVSFLRVYERMPSIDVILNNPAQAPIITDPATLYAVASALVFRADKDNLHRVVKYFDRIKDAGRPDFACVAHKEISLKKPDLCKTRAYIEWSSTLAPFLA